MRLKRDHENVVPLFLGRHLLSHSYDESEWSARIAVGRFLGCRFGMTGPVEGSNTVLKMYFYTAMMW